MTHRQNNQKIEKKMGRERRREIESKNKLFNSQINLIAPIPSTPRAAEKNIKRSLTEKVIKALYFSNPTAHRIRKGIFESQNSKNIHYAFIIFLLRIFFFSFSLRTQNSFQG